MFVKNTKNYKIKTQNGQYVSFEGVAYVGHRPAQEVTFTDDSKIVGSGKHTFYTTSGLASTIDILKNDDLLQGDKNNKQIKNIVNIGEQDLYDIINVETKTFYANGVLCHNCDFLSADSLLIDGIVLNTIVTQIDKHDPIFVKHGVKFWKEIEQNGIYLIGVDPATGSQSDYSVISIFEFPSIEQVAEFRTNDISSAKLYLMLKGIIKFLEQYQTTIYYTVENNGVGEGLITARELDETPPMTAVFYTDPNGKRPGVTTTGKVKMVRCLKLKELLETGTMIIHSTTCVNELKSFTKSGGSYAAQSGATDDCVSAILIVITLLDMLAQFEDAAHEKMYSLNNETDVWSDENGSDDQEMPIII